MNLICTNYSNTSHPDFLHKKKIEACKKIACLSIAVFSLIIGLVIILNYYVPKGFYPGSIGLCWAVGFTSIALYALYSVVEWKKLKGQHKVKNYSVFGFDGFEKLDPEKIPRSTTKAREIVVDGSKRDISSLPDDILSSIMLNLQASDLGHLERTCKRIQKLLNDKSIFWKGLLEKNFEARDVPDGNFKREYRLLTSWQENRCTLYKKGLSFRSGIQFLILNDRFHLKKGDRYEDAEGHKLSFFGDPWNSTFAETSSFLLACSNYSIKVFNKQYQYLFDLVFPIGKKSVKSPPLIQTNVVAMNVSWDVYSRHHLFEVSRMYETSKYLMHVAGNAIFAFDKKTGNYFDHIEYVQPLKDFVIADEKLVYTSSGDPVYIVNEEFETKTIKTSFSGLQIKSAPFFNKKRYFLCSSSTPLANYILFDSEFRSFEVLPIQTAAANFHIWKAGEYLSVHGVQKVEIFNLLNKQTVAVLDLHEDEWESFITYKNFLCCHSEAMIKIVDMRTGNSYTLLNYQEKEGREIIHFKVHEGKILARVQRHFLNEWWFELVVFDFGSFLI